MIINSKNQKISKENYEAKQVINLIKLKNKNIEIKIIHNIKQIN